MSLFEYDTIKKWQVNKMRSRQKFKSDGNGKEYKVEAICNSVVYAKELEGHLPGLYYLVS